MSPDLWCDWCQREFGPDEPDWKVETGVVTGWFCSEDCADAWGCAADSPEHVDGERVATDGGFETRTFRVGPARTVAYGPAGADSSEWALRFTSEDGERVTVRLDEDAMYELWTEVHNVPWPSREDDRHDLQREIVARAERADAEMLREVLNVLGGDR